MGVDLRNWWVLSSLSDDFIRRLRFVFVFGFGRGAIVITEDDEAFGVGDYGDDEPDNDEMALARKMEVLCKQNIKGMACGKNHMLAFNSDGLLFSWGQNNFCKLGYGSEFMAYHTPRLVGALTGERVVQVSCGVSHSLALTDDGKVFAWGDVWPGLNKVHKPSIVTEGIKGRKAVSISCTSYSSLILLDDGQLYGWGYNMYGEVGIGDRCPQSSPALIRFNDKIKQMCCGWNYCLALTNQGVIFAWGKNNSGQLGIGSATPQFSPVRISSIYRSVVQIAACPRTRISAAQLDNDTICAWGEWNCQHIHTPLPILVKTIEEAFLGDDTRNPIILTNQVIESVETLQLPALDDQNTADICFQVDGREIWAHKSILKERCQYFYNMFQRHWPDDNNRVIRIGDFSYSVYCSFLNYLYSGNVDFTNIDFVDLLELADCYCEPLLKSVCQYYIRQEAEVDDIATLYEMALRYEARDLECYCIKVGLDNLQDVMLSKSFRELPESIAKQFVRGIDRAKELRLVPDSSDDSYMSD